MRKRFQEKQAAYEARQTAGDEEEADYGSLYDLMQGQLNQHLRLLSNVKSTERKVGAKEGFIGAYEDYIKGVLAADSPRQDNVLARMMVWHLDIGNIDEALAIAEHLIKHDLSLPNDFESTPASHLCEFIAELSIKSNDSVTIEQLNHVHTLVEEQDIYDQVRAKLHKALGIHLQETDPEAAKIHFERAIELHDACGAKNLLNKLKK